MLLDKSENDIGCKSYDSSYSLFKKNWLLHYSQPQRVFFIIIILMRIDKPNRILKTNILLPIFTYFYNFILTNQMCMFSKLNKPK